MWSNPTGELRGPVALYGVLGALLLILVASFLGGGVQSQVLTKRFTPDPNAPKVAPFEIPKLDIPGIPPLPDNLGSTLGSVKDRFSGQQPSAPVDSTSSSGTQPSTTGTSGVRVKIDIDSVGRDGSLIVVKGRLTNIAQGNIVIPVEAFVFIDTSGERYLAKGPPTTLQPNQYTTIDLSIPVKEGYGLKLDFQLPPDPTISIPLVEGGTPK
jgi:hypothetical protein